MASNETVAEIKYRIYSHWRGCENCSLEEMNGADLIAIADQFEAAHNREMNHRAIIAGVSLADAVDDEHKRELAAKDDERLTIVANYETVIAAKDAKDAEIAELRECLKEAVFVMQTLFDERMPKWRKALGGANDETK